MTMPTVGRIVSYFLKPRHPDSFVGHGGDGPYAAIITHVWGPAVLNLAVFDSNGNLHSVVSVELREAGAEDSGLSAWAEWPTRQ